MAKQKVIIDVDTGVDDAQAIMMALSASDKFDILAITCVSGNIDVDQVCYNTLRVLTTCKRLEVPVFKGAFTPLVCQPAHAADQHGNDGLGGVPPLSNEDQTDISLVQQEHAVSALMRLVPVFKGASSPLVCQTAHGVDHHGNDGLGNAPPLSNEKQPDVSLMQKEHAVSALNRLVNENQGEVLLIALAPLTNIALALKMDPKFGEKLKHTIIMGGNIEGKGNVTATGEFNFHFDPEAAHVVLRDLKSSIQILCWEPCFDNGIPWVWYEALLRKQDTPVQRLHSRINEHPIERKKTVLKCESYYSCDPAAMSVAIEPSCVIAHQKAYCAVELQGQLTRGQMVVDWRGKFGKEPNVDIVTKIDIEKVKQLYVKMLEQ